MEGLKGLDRLQRTLTAIGDKASRKAAKAGVNAGMTVLTRHIRKWVNASPGSPRVKKAARTTIGKSFKFGPRGVPQAKGGFGVGRQSKGRKEKATLRAADKTKKGVGISASDIHWFVLGTKKREQTTTGRSTGKVSPVLKGIIPAAVQTAGGPMLTAAANKVRQVLAAEAAKLRKG